MDRKIILTGDGSHTISVPELKIAYHSIHGAMQESMHVYINSGMKYMVSQLPDSPLTIFEMGFGTGLNALLTLMEADKAGTKIYYEAVELNPLNETEVSSLNYCRVLNRPDLQPVFKFMHQCEWNKEIMVADNFNIKKINISLFSHLTSQQFNLIYFDAFAPNVRPEQWTREVFDKMYFMLAPGGVLVTYCSKGDVRRAMISAGFAVEKMPGPPRKREMIRAAHP